MRARLPGLTLLRTRNGAIAVDQVVSSGSNALALVLMGTVLAAGEFNVYTLLQLVLTTVIAFQRAFISEPTLALKRAEVVYDPLRVWLTILAAVALLGAAVLGGLGATGSLFAVAGVAPLVQDALRYRALSFGHVYRVLVSDVVWLVLLCVALAVVRPDSSSRGFLVWTLTAVPAVLPLVVLRTPPEVRHSLREVVGIGRFGASDVAIAAVTGLVPLLVVNALVPLSSVGAFRLSQTLLGPVNVVSGTVAVHMLVAADELDAETDDDLRRRAARVNRRVTQLVCVYVACVAAFVVLYARTLDAVTSSQLAYVFPLTAVALVFTSRAIPYNAILRASGQQRRGVKVRLLLLLGSVLSLAVSLVVWRLGGLDPLVLPLVVTAAITFIAWRAVFETFLGERGLRGSGAADDLDRSSTQRQAVPHRTDDA